MDLLPGTYRTLMSRAKEQLRKKWTIMEWDNIFDDYHRTPRGTHTTIWTTVEQQQAKSPLRWWGIAALLLAFSNLLPPTQSKSPRTRALLRWGSKSKIKTIETRFGQQHTATIEEIKKKIAVLDREYQTLVERLKITTNTHDSWKRYTKSCTTLATPYRIGKQTRTTT